MEMKDSNKLRKEFKRIESSIKYKGSDLLKELRKDSQKNSTEFLVSQKTDSFLRTNTEQDIFKNNCEQVRERLKSGRDKIIHIKMTDSYKCCKCSNKY